VRSARLYSALGTWHFALGTYLVLALAWSWPLPVHLANRFTHDPGDPLLVTYLIWWNAQTVPLTAAWWNAPFYWPMPGALALTEHVAGLAVLTTPLQWLGASALLAYNLILIASTWWAGLATHALVRRLGGSTIAAFCAGIAFAYAPYRVSQLGHLQLYACWWLPVTLLALHGYYDDRRARWLVVAGMSWLLQGLTNGYFLLFVPVLVACWLAWFTRRAQLRAGLTLMVSFGAAALTALPFLLKYHAVQSALGLTRTRGEMVAYSARAESFLSATPLLRFWQTRPPMTPEHYLFPGVTALALFIAGLAFARRDRRFQFYALAALLMTGFAAGPAPVPHSIEVVWHPYSLLVWLPGFNGLRVPARFYMLAVLCLAVAAGLSFDAIARRLPGRRSVVALAILVLAGLAFDGTIAGMPLGAPPGQLSLRDRNARVISLPFEDGRASVFAMYQSMGHRLPVVNGYAGYIPPHADAIEWALRRRDPTVLMELRRGHPLYVIVAATEHAATWTSFMDAQPGVEFLGIEGGGRLYRMAPAAYAREARPGRPLADTIVNASPEWLTANLRTVQPIRGIELNTNGNLVLLPKDLHVQTSVDGSQWTTAFEDRPGGLVLIGALRLPRAMPIRVDLGDVDARYVRVNTPAFRAGAVTIYAP
jgi:hypothetical protein